MHCTSFHISENFDMHTLKQVYNYVICVALYGLDRVQSVVWIWLSENPEFHQLVLPAKPISKSKHILGLSLKAKV